MTHASKHPGCRIRSDPGYLPLAAPLTWRSHQQTRDQPVRTILFLLAGLLLLASTYIVAKLLSEVFPSAPDWATGLFVALWLAAAGANFMGGVTRAGYSASEELPVLLLISAVPLIGMILVRWKLL